MTNIKDLKIKELKALFKSFDSVSKSVRDTILLHQIENELNARGVAVFYKFYN